MALEKSRFFDSVGDDRIYQANQFAEYFRLFLTDGIKNGGTNLKVTAPGSGLVVTVEYGVAMIQGYAYWLDNDGSGQQQIQIAAADPQPRVDRVILKLDRSLSERNIKLGIKRGTPATAPLPPALTRTENIYELALAQVKVAANALKIVSADVVDERYDAATCGLINSLITLDSTDYNQQAQAILARLADQGYLPLHARADDAAKFDGFERSAFATAAQGIKADNALPATAQAADSTKLGGQLPSAFATAEQGAKADAALPANTPGQLPKNYISISSNTDLNNIKTAGFYACLDYNIGKSLYNSPYESAFYMQVLTGYGCVQILYPYDSPKTIWVRDYYDGKWTNWSFGDADTLHGYYTSEKANSTTIVTRDSDGNIFANQIVANISNNALWGGWHCSFQISTGSHGAIYNDASGTMIGLNANKNIYFGNNYDKKYYQSFGGDGIYDYVSNGFVRAVKSGSSLPAASAGVSGQIFVLI